MTKRTFQQYCPIARALDVVGERWSLLIVRELLVGPKRYTDLRQALPGMWTNLLADRLRQLEAAGVIRRAELPPPAARTVYELTERGRELQGVLFALARWGLPLLTEDGDGDGEPPVATAVVVGLRAFFRPEAVEADERYELRLAGTTWTAAVHGGHGGGLELRPGAPDAPAATLETTPAALLDLRLGTIDRLTAEEDGRFRLQGAPDAVLRFRRTFSLDTATTSSAGRPRPR